MLLLSRINLKRKHFATGLNQNHQTWDFPSAINKQKQIGLDPYHEHLYESEQIIVWELSRNSFKMIN